MNLRISSVAISSRVAMATVARVQTESALRAAFLGRPKNRTRVNGRVGLITSQAHAIEAVHQCCLPRRWQTEVGHEGRAYDQSARARDTLPDKYLVNVHMRWWATLQPCSSASCRASTDDKVVVGGIFH